MDAWKDDGTWDLDDLGFLLGTTVEKVDVEFLLGIREATVERIRKELDELRIKENPHGQLQRLP
jgi:hypothetical protein